MDTHYELHGLSFVWDAAKAAANARRHDGITFEQAATVFFDPLFRLVEAGTVEEARDAVIGYDASGRLLFVVHVEVAEEVCASSLPARPPPRSAEPMTIPDRIKTRLAKDRPMTSITLRIPVDVVESMKEIAPQRGFSGYQALLKSYLGEGLRRDEAQYGFGATARLIEALKRRGVPPELLEEAARESTAA